MVFPFDRPTYTPPNPAWGPGVVLGEFEFTGGMQSFELEWPAGGGVLVAWCRGGRGTMDPASPNYNICTYRTGGAQPPPNGIPEYWSEQRPGLSGTWRVLVGGDANGRIGGYGGGGDGGVGGGSVGGESFGDGGGGGGATILFAPNGRTWCSAGGTGGALGYIPDEAPRPGATGTTHSSSPWQLSVGGPLETGGVNFGMGGNTWVGGEGWMTWNGGATDPYDWTSAPWFDPDDLTEAGFIPYRGGAPGQPFQPAAGTFAPSRGGYGASHGDWAGPGGGGGGGGAPAGGLWLGGTLALGAGAGAGGGGGTVNWELPYGGRRSPGWWRQWNAGCGGSAIAQRFAFSGAQEMRGEYAMRTEQGQLANWPWYGGISEDNGAMVVEFYEAPYTPGGWSIGQIGT